MRVGVRRHMLSLPMAIGRRRVSAFADQARSVIGGLSALERRLHRFLVAELTRAGEPLTPDAVAEALDLSREDVVRMLDALGARKALIARNADGAVTWAYPVTVTPTAHHLRFRSGERLYAA